MRNIYKTENKHGKSLRCNVRAYLSIGAHYLVRLLTLAMLHTI